MLNPNNNYNVILNYKQTNNKVDKNIKNDKIINKTNNSTNSSTLKRNLVIKNKKGKLDIDKITIATLNVRTLKGEERMLELENVLEQTQIDILGVSEVRIFGEE